MELKLRAPRRRKRFPSAALGQKQNHKRRKRFPSVALSRKQNHRRRKRFPSDPRRRKSVPVLLWAKNRTTRGEKGFPVLL